MRSTVCVCRIFPLLLLTQMSPAIVAMESNDARLTELTQRLQAGLPEDRAKAARGLKRIGPAAEAAIPALVKALLRPDRTGEEAKALGRIGAAAIPDLLKAIKVADAESQVACVNALGQMGPAAKAAIPDLLMLVDRPPGPVRTYSIMALCRIGPDDERVVAVLSAILRDAKAGERQWIARCLEELGPSSHKFAPALVDALAFVEFFSGYGDMTADGQKALIAIGEPAVPVVVAGLKHASSKVGVQCSQVLMALGPKAVAAGVDAMLPLLKDSSVHVRMGVCRVLGKAREPRVVQALVDVLTNDSEYSVQIPAASSLGEIGPIAASALVGLLDKDRKISRLAAEALITIGPEAKAVIPNLIALLQEQPVDSEVVKALARICDHNIADIAKLVEGAGIARSNGIAVLKEMGPFVPEAALILGRLLRDPDIDIRRAAAEALAAFGRAAHETTIDLAKLLHGSDLNSRLGALHALEAIGPEAHQTLPAIRSALTDSSHTIREAAVLAFAAIERSPDALIPQFRAALDDKRESVRSAAVQMLERMDEDARPAAPALAKLLDRSQPDEIRTRAASALRYILSEDPAVHHSLVLALTDKATVFLASKALSESKLDAGLVPVLVELLRKTEDLTEIQLICHALLKFGKDAAPATAGLLKSMRREIDRPRRGSADLFRSASVEVLTAIGAPAVPGLLEYVRDENDRLSEVALGVLSAMAPGEANDAVPVLVKLCERGKPLDSTLIEIFRKAGPNAKAAIPLLQRAARHVGTKRPWGKTEYPDRSLAIVAEEALAQIAGDPKPAIEKFATMLRNEQKLEGYPVQAGIVADEDRALITSALARLGRPALPLLLEALQDPRRRVRFGAYLAIQEMKRLEEIPHATVEQWLSDLDDPTLGLYYAKDAGAQAAFTAPLLVKILVDGEWIYDTLPALKAIGPAAKEATPQLIAMFNDAKWRGWREEITEVWSTIGPEAQPALPLLVSIVRDRAAYPSSLYWGACKAIQSIGPAARPVAPELAGVLRQIPNAFYGILPALGALEADQPQFIDVLIDTIVSTNSIYAGGHSPRSMACDALGQIGPTAAKAIPFVVVATHDQNHEVRKAARQALRRIQPTGR